MSEQNQPQPPNVNHLVEMMKLASALSTQLKLLGSAWMWAQNDITKIENYGRDPEVYLSLSHHAGEAAVAHGKAASIVDTILLMQKFVDPNSVPDHVTEVLASARGAGIRFP